MKPRTRPSLTALIALTAALLALGVAASSAAATAPSAASSMATGGNAGGWERFHAESFTAAAGTLCPFTLHSEVLFDREYFRTTRTYSNGDPRTQEYVGPLVVRVVNKDTGKSVVRDLSGRAVLEYAPDGSYDFRIQGPAAVGFHPGDSLPPGFYVLRGEHVVHFAADGTRTMVLDRGSEENLCTTLA